MHSQSRKPIGVEVKSVSKAYGQHEVLHDISFSVHPGEIFVIMGPSGSGKSVLLRQIIGLETPDRGEVLIDGRSVTVSSTQQKVRMAMVFQAGALFHSMTVFENCALYLHEHRLCPKKEIPARVQEVLRQLSLEKAADQYPAQLSGGMKKRVAVARALVMEPQLLLYDEPTSELDPVMAVTVAELIATVRAETGLTSIVVSHDRELALGIGDRIALLWQGSIALIDTPQGVQQNQQPELVSFLHPKIDLQQPGFRKE